jgi:hypothetical protein
MKATETKSTHSQQHGATDKSSASQEQEHAFFSESTSERSPFFNPAAGVGLQAKFVSDRTPFFQPTRVPAVQMKCAACEAEEREQAEGSNAEALTVQRMPAFESDEADVQRQPISVGAPQVIQQMPAFESDEDTTEAGEETIQRKVTPGINEIASTAATLQPKCEACKAEELEKQEEPTEETPQMQMMSAFDGTDGAGNSDDTNDEPTLQFSLTIGQPGDAYEREADAMAEKVVSSPESQLQASLGDEEKNDTNPVETIQRKSSLQKAPDGSLSANNEAASRISHRRGQGSPLDDATRSRMEPAFGADFSDVRIHADSEAAQLNQDLGAQAFTHGSDIYFNEGKYNPASQDGERLLAHELTHTVQQGASDTRIQKKPEDYLHPEDGRESKEGINKNIKDELGEDKDINHPQITAEEKSQEKPPESEKGENVDKEELKQDAKPTVDRKEETQPQIDQQINQLNQEVQEKPEQEKPSDQEVSSEKKKLSPKEKAALRAVEAFAKASQEPRKVEVTPVKPLKIEEPKDAHGKPLQRNPQAEALLPRIAQKIQSLRLQGGQLKEHAEEERLEAERMRGQIHLMYHGVYTSDEFIEQAREHTTNRQTILEGTKEQLRISEERVNKVLTETPGILEKANEGKEESDPMVKGNQERREKNESTNNPDADAKKESEKRSGKLAESEKQAQGIDDAITQTKDQAGTMLEDAAVAQQRNEEVKAEIKGMDEKLVQTQAKLDETTAQNTEAKAQLAAQERKPDQHIQRANALDREADEAILRSENLENDLHQAQQDYLNKMHGVPGHESTGGGVIQTKGEDGQGGIIQLQGTEQEGKEKERQQQQETHNNEYQKRLQDLDASLDTEFEHMNFLDKTWFGLRHLYLSIMAGLAEVKWAKFFEEMIQSLVDPVKLWTGMQEMFNRAITPKHRPNEDPLTYVLREAAGWATAIAITFGLLAGLTLIGMVALAVINFWFPPSLVWSAPIYAELGTFLAWTGAMLWATTKIALVLHAVVFVGDLIATAFSPTAEALRENSRQLHADVEAASFPILTAVTVGFFEFLGVIGKKLGIGKGAGKGKTAESETTKPAEGEPAKPTKGEPAKPTKGEPAKPTKGEPAKPSEGKPTKDLGKEGGKKVLAEEPTLDGHKVKITEDGTAVICSPTCPKIRKAYAEELADPANSKLKTEFETVDAIDGKINPRKKAKAEAKIRKKLVKARNQKLSELQESLGLSDESIKTLQEQQVKPSLVKKLIDKGIKPNDVAFYSEVPHGLKILEGLLDARIQPHIAERVVSLAESNGLLDQVSALVSKGSLQNPTKLRGTLEAINKGDPGLLNELNIASDLAKKGHKIELGTQGDIVDLGKPGVTPSSKEVMQVKRVSSGKKVKPEEQDAFTNLLQEAENQLAGRSAKGKPKTTEIPQPGFTRVADITIANSKHPLFNANRATLSKWINDGLHKSLMPDGSPVVERVRIRNNLGVAVFKAPGFKP